MSARSQAGILRSVEVELGERSYPVQIGSGTLGELGPELKRRTGASRAVLITDRKSVV